MGSGVIVMEHNSFAIRKCWPFFFNFSVQSHQLLALDFRIDRLVPRKELKMNNSHMGSTRTVNIFKWKISRVNFWNQFWQVRSVKQSLPYTSQSSLWASVDLCPLQKRKSKICRKCSFCDAIEKLKLRNQGYSQLYTTWSRGSQKSTDIEYKHEETISELYYLQNKD